MVSRQVRETGRLRHPAPSAALRAVGRATVGRMADHPAARPDAAEQVLGLLACGEVFGFHTLSDASVRSADFGQSVTLMQMAVQHAQGYERTRQRLLDHGVAADDLICSFAAPLAEYHARTSPNDEFEALLKAYVGTGIAADFMREMASKLDDDTHRFVLDVLSVPKADEVVVPRLRAVLAQDQAHAGPMALWGRRLMGEALSQAQRVAADRPELLALILGPDDLEGFQQMIARMTSSHSGRMRALALYP